MSFERAQRLADAVLLEGYVLYPYRPDTTKNRYRWTFGVVAPRRWSERGGCEPWWLRAQVLVAGEAPAVRARLRFMRVVERRVEERVGAAYRRVERLDVRGRAFLGWEEGELVEIEFAVPLAGATATPISLPANEEIETITKADGTEAGRVVRARAALAGAIEAGVDWLSTNGGPLARVTVRVENLTPFEALAAPRADAVRSAFVSAHVLLAVERGRFLSLVDPPAYALAAAASCSNVGTHPVVVAEAGRDDLVLAAPIILSEHPGIAPESPGDFCDAGEIDELLALRTRTLGDEEKALARATDARTAELVDRAVALTDAQLARLHGVAIGASGERRPLLSRFHPGARVRLRPDLGGRRTDAQDLLYVGRCATIEAVRKDVDGRDYLAVTLDDDPIVEMHRAKGRFHYYYPDEVELVHEEVP